MTVDYTKAAILDVVDFLKAELATAGFTGFVVYPAGVAQEITDDNYIIYDRVSLGNTGDDYWVMKESASFTIYSKSITTIFSVQTFLTDIFRRQDITAREINATGTSPNMFLNVYLDVADQTAWGTGGGASSKSIYIEYNYTRAINGTGRFAS